MDGRFAVLRAIPECRALDTANDVLALSQEGRVRLVMLAQEAKALIAAAYEHHVMDDWAGFLDVMSRLDRDLTEIRDASRRWADDVTSAPEMRAEMTQTRAADMRGNGKR